MTQSDHHSLDPLLNPNSFSIDGQRIAFTPGQSILQAALDAGVFIPHLCHHPELKPHGSCKLCTIVINGRNGSACTVKALPGLEVESDTPAINDRRRVLLQMLFVEGNHFCLGCEKSGNCELQALAYTLEMVSPHFRHAFPDRVVDASHPDVWLDLNRCILCAQCVRASRDVDGKQVFSLSGRGQYATLVVNSASGKLGDSTLSLDDAAAHVCPVGAILPKRVGYATPIGQRQFDAQTIDQQTGYWQHKHIAIVPVSEASRPAAEQEVKS